MGNTARYFLPCRRFLGTQKVARVFEHQNKPALLFERSDGDGEVHDCVWSLYVKLRSGGADAPGTFQQVTNLGEVFAREQVLEQLRIGCSLRREYAGERSVDALDPFIRGN